MIIQVQNQVLLICWNTNYELTERRTTELDLLYTNSNFKLSYCYMKSHLQSYFQELLEILYLLFLR